MLYTNIAILVCAFLFMGVILIETIAIYRIRMRQDSEYRELYNYFLSMVILDLILLFMCIIQAYLSVKAQGSGFLTQIRHISEIGIQFSYYGLLGLFVLYIAKYIGLREKREIHLAPLIMSICAIWALLWSISSYNGMIVRITEEGISRGPLYWFGQAGGYFCLVFICVLIIKNRKVLNGRDILTLLSPVIFPLGISLLRNRWRGLNYMPVAMSLSLLVFYGFIHMEDAWEAKEQEVQLANARVNLMLSQIRPHFLYNTLNSIYVLCGRDPELAQRAIHDFTSYLRKNLNALEEEREIPFVRELEHVKYYLELEKLRFPDRLKVIYDIQTEDCRIPPLTLQPLVENAVKHGLIKKREGGTITVSSRLHEGTCEIVIRDDGVGIPAEKLKEIKEKILEIQTDKKKTGFSRRKNRPEEEIPGQEKEHVGIRNVAERLWRISRSVLNIESSPEEGTTVIVTLKPCGL